MATIKEYWTTEQEREALLDRYDVMGWRLVEDARHTNENYLIFTDEPYVEEPVLTCGSFEPSNPNMSASKRIEHIETWLIECSKYILAKVK